MHPIIIDCVRRLETYMASKARAGHELDVRRAMGNLTMDVIAACAFGTQIDTHNDNVDNEFVMHAQRVFRGNWRMWVLAIMMVTFPKLAEWTELTFQPPETKRFFQSAVSIMIHFSYYMC